MKIKDLPESSQPRERFLKHGPEVLSDAELFAIILRTGVVGENVMEMSNRLISEFGLVNLFECSLKELQVIKGIGPNKAMQLLAMVELGKRYDQEKNSIKKITCAEDVFKLFHNDFKNKKQEHFSILMLNTQNNIIKKEPLTIGILNASVIHPREVFKPAIKNSCNKIILVHNHPSGDPTPSEEDLEITRKMIEVGEELEIRVLDHIIVGDNNWWSWKEKTLK